MHRTKMFAFDRIGILFLITRICLTDGILSSNSPEDPSKPKNLSSDGPRYLLASLKQPFPKNPEQGSHLKQKTYLGDDRPESPRRSSYRIFENPDDYSPEHLDDQEFRGYPRADENFKNLAKAVKILDNFLSKTLNDESYNSELHPPLNPVLALLLSKYGRHVPGLRTPRFYSYQAINNIHNNKPFGKYKLECDDDPTSFL